MLDSLVESLPTARLLLLINYRPEYQHTWGSKTYCTQIRLDPLPPASAEALLAALLGDDPSLAPLKTLLIARTEGNPFFLEETVRTLVETGTCVGAPGAYRLAHDLRTVQVPPTVQAVLAARIDRLPQEEKRLLQTAAVIGTDVPLPLLQAIDELPEDARERGLTHLQAAELLYETSLFPDRVYTFKHALTHEVAYNGLLQERRRGIHARIVEALEVLCPDRLTEQVQRLAHHAFQGAVWAKTCLYYRQAGTRALAQSAYRAAMVAYEQALETLAHLPQEREHLEQAIDLRLALRPALVALDAHERQVSNMHAAETLATALNDPWRLGLIYSGLVVAYRATSNTERALTYSQRCHALATMSRDLALQIMASQRLGQLYYDLGDYRRAMAYFRSNVASLQGASRYERFGANTDGGLPVLVALAYLAWCLAEAGEFAEGLAYGNDALRLVESIDNRYDHVVVLFRVGRFHLRHEQGHQAQALWLLGEIARHGDSPEIEPATTHYQEAIILAVALGMRPLQAHCHDGLGTLYSQTAQSEQARAELHTAITLYRAMAMTFWLPQAEATLTQMV